MILGIEYFSKKNRIIPKSQEIFIITGTLISAIIGARTYHVIDNWSYYSNNIILIPQTWLGGLGIFGGIICGTIFIILYSISHNYNFLKILDSITPILPLCQSIGRLGNWVNQENPTWWIESGLNLLLFFFIFKFPNKPTAKYLIGYGLIRYTTEFYRLDTWVYQNIKIGQIISIILIIIGLWLHLRKNPTRSHSKKP